MNNYELSVLTLIAHFSLFIIHRYTAFLTLPDRRHLVQTFCLLFPWAVSILIFCRFGINTRLVLLLAWLTLLPVTFFFPQTEHTAICESPPNKTHYTLFQLYIFYKSGIGSKIYETIPKIKCPNFYRCKRLMLTFVFIELESVQKFGFRFSSLLHP